MNALTTNTAVTMTSLELVDYINSQRGEGESELRHADFLEKVPKVLSGGERKFSSTYRDVQNKERPCFTFPKREACLMAMSYSYDLQAKVFDRMTALEEHARNPITAMNRVELLKLALDSEEQRAALEHKVEVLAPKAAALDRIATVGNGSYCIREAAKMLNVQEKRLRQRLQEIHWIYHPPVGGNWMGYAGARDKGYVEHKRTEGEKADGTRWESVQVRITDKGLAKLAILLQTEEEAA